MLAGVLVVGCLSLCLQNLQEGIVGTNEHISSSPFDKGNGWILAAFFCFGSQMGKNAEYNLLASL